MKKKKAIIWWMSIALCVLFIGCTAPANTAEEDAADGSASSGLDEAQVIMHAEDWKDVYPDIYTSYMRGADTQKDKGGLPLAHTHVLIRADLETALTIPPFSFSEGRGCIACKTADSSVLYEKYGEDLFRMTYDSLKAENIDGWGCYNCHGNDPANNLGVYSAGWRLLVGDYVDSIAPGDAACGQCHNALSRYEDGYVLGSDKLLVTYKPYRYGTDADAILKAILEDGEMPLTDQDGVDYYLSVNPEVEMFQGSTMQKLGLSCVSCHMPKETSVSGTEYTGHNASGSPLENDAALAFCLSCHETQGIEDKDAMVAFVKGKQTELGAINDEVKKLQDELHKRIVAGSGDEQTDAKARALYLKASWYQEFAISGANIAGTKAAHDFAEQKGNYEKALKIVQEGLDLYLK